MCWRIRKGYGRPLPSLFLAQVVLLLLELTAEGFRFPPSFVFCWSLRDLVIRAGGSLRNVPPEELGHLTEREEMGEVSSDLNLTSVSALLGSRHFFRVVPFILASIDLLILWDRMMFLALFLKDFFCF